MLRDDPGPAHLLGRFELVIFDCDGVLVDSERLTVGIEAQVLTSLGWPMDADEVVRRWMGRTSAAQLAEVAERLGRAAAEEYDRRSTAAVRAAFARDLRAVEGVVEVLDALAGLGIPTCVASSGTPARMQHTLGLTGLLDHFEGRIFSAVEVAEGKPAPDLFLHAAARMGAAPARCAVVEDSVPGVRGGVSAGMTVFGYAGGLTGEAELVAAGAEPFRHMRDLLGVSGG
ncbi:MAG TPA: HAD family hydrolase [Marmoricola sp.]|nr:HAD family hydrolase [Marmoricola sp.]